MKIIRLALTALLASAAIINALELQTPNLSFAVGEFRSLSFAVGEFRSR
jgi:hypothetical protein